MSEIETQQEQAAAGKPTIWWSILLGWLGALIVQIRKGRNNADWSMTPYWVVGTVSSLVSMFVGTFGPLLLIGAVLSVSPDRPSAEAASSGVPSPASSSETSVPDDLDTFTQVTFTGSASSEATARALIAAADRADVAGSRALVEKGQLLVQLPGAATQNVLEAMQAAAGGMEVSAVEGGSRVSGQTMPSRGAVLALPCPPATASGLGAAVAGASTVWSVQGTPSRAEVVVAPSQNMAAAGQAAIAVCGGTTADLIVNAFVLVTSA